MAPKRNHYVPIWYQERFTLPGQRGKRFLWVYDKDSPHDSPRAQQPINTGVEGHLYTTEVPGREAFIEEEFQRLEGAVQPIIARWLTSTDRFLAETDDLPIAASFIASMLHRSPRQIDAVKEIEAIIAGASIKEVAQDEGRFAEVYSKLGIGESGVSEEVLRAELLSVGDRYRIQPDRTGSMLMSIANGEATLHVLLSMHWSLYRAPSGHEFVTSDCPVNVMVAHPAEKKAIFGGGLSDPNCEVRFPLSPDTCVGLRYRPAWAMAQVNAAFVDDMNRRTVAMSERFVLARNRTPTVGALVTEYAGTRGRPKFEREVILQRRALRQQQHSRHPPLQ